MNYCLNNNENILFYHKLNDDYLAYANILKLERPIWKDALISYFEYISPKMVNDITIFNNEQLMRIKNNIDEYYNKEFESLKITDNFKNFKTI